MPAGHVKRDIEDDLEQNQNKKAPGASPLKVGVVGVGYLGKYHAEKYAAMPDVELVGLSDISEEKCGPPSQNYGAVACTDYRDLLDRVDAVSIAVPTIEHYRVARDFLLHGKDVLIEKPITRTLEEADELIALGREKGAFIQVGHLEQFNPAVVALREELTTPMFVESHRIGPFKERGTDVDVVLDLMIHDLDIILCCVNSELTAMDAVGVPVISPQVDIANVRLNFASGCVANVTASRISFKMLRKIRIFQPNAYLTVDYAKRELVVIEKKPGGKEFDPSQISGKTLRFEDVDPLEEELKAFVQSVKTRTVPLVDGTRGREALRLSLDITRLISSKLESLSSV